MTQRVSVTVNGVAHEADIDERTLLLYFLRDTLGFTGAHNGCLEGRCGCCAVLVDGQAVKSCNVLAVQVDGASITTVEGMATLPAQAEGPRWLGELAGPARDDDAQLTPLQRAFHRNGAVQCGFCTPGMLAVLTDLLASNPDPTAQEVREGIRGNLCRCTGYQKIVDAALDAAAELRQATGEAIPAMRGVVTAP